VAWCKDLHYLNVSNGPTFTVYHTTIYHLCHPCRGGHVHLHKRKDFFVSKFIVVARDRQTTPPRSDHCVEMQIDDVQKQRNLHRKGRENLGLSILALVVYTNSGESTLLNFFYPGGDSGEKYFVCDTGSDQPENEASRIRDTPGGFVDRYRWVCPKTINPVGSGTYYKLPCTFFCVRLSSFESCTPTF